MTEQRESFTLRLRMLVLTAALLWPVSVFSETSGLGVDSFVNGNKLFRLCSAHDHGEAQGYCLGYVVGVADAFTAVDALKAPGLANAIRSTCPPEHVDADQVRDVVVQYLTAHPATRHNAATHEVLAALLAAFPCKEQAH
jgi:hypothetical protein